MPEDFPSFFHAATGKPAPYDYQSQMTESHSYSLQIILH
jgi:hypothetical protein